MNKPTLGRLMPVPPRTYWADEARDFTPWLAAEENIELLGNAIGMELEVQETEASVGPFRADILCHDTRTEGVVLVENQLAPTDHTHLGQLFTYAAGLDAVTVVWIAERFREEHRAAVDWLNRITHEDFRFFGIEVQLWKIGDSALAPKFNLVAKPNDWSKTVREAAAATRGPSSESEQLYFDYWQAFAELMEETGSRVKLSKPAPRYYVKFGVGRTGYSLSAVAAARDQWAGVQLTLEGDDPMADLDSLMERRGDLERELGFAIKFNRDPTRRMQMVEVTRAGDPSDRASWPELHAWTLEKLDAFDRVFRPLVRQLPLETPREGEADA